MDRSSNIRMLVVLLFLLQQSTAWGQEFDSRSLKVVAHNVHLLPKVAAKVAGKRSDNEYRARAIADEFYDHDILGISEAFEKECSRSFVRRLQDKSEDSFTIVNGPGRTGRHLIGSGLLLASKYPVVETNSITYSDASRFLDSGFKADGFAAKGALHVRIRLGKSSHALIDCFLTHLESRSDVARDKQIVQFAEFVADHTRPRVPAILLGDFNVGANLTDSQSQYSELLKALHNPERTLIDTGQTVMEGPKGTSDANARNGGRRIDYIFLSENRASGRVRLKLLHTQHLRLLDEKVKQGSLSDHLAVQAVLRAEFKDNSTLPLRTTRRSK